MKIEQLHRAQEITEEIHKLEEELKQIYGGIIIQNE